MILLMEFFSVNFLSFFSIFFLLMVGTVLFIFVKLCYNSVFVEVKDFFMTFYVKTTVFRTFVFNLAIFFGSYYVIIKLVLVDFFEVVEFLFYEDVEYVTPMRFHKHFPTILDW